MVTARAQSYVIANGDDNDFPCCLKYMLQFLGSCHALSVLGGGVGGGVRVGGGVGVGGGGWGRVGWGGIITSLACPHIRT